MQYIDLRFSNHPPDCANQSQLVALEALVKLLLFTCLDSPEQISTFFFSFCLALLFMLFRSASASVIAFISAMSKGIDAFT